uniref:Uncharacterized protein n=1 Tax=Oryza nivara TaxID=4536 RepID=A0A0E0I0I9_ORYNI
MQPRCYPPGHLRASPAASDRHRISSAVRLPAAAREDHMEAAAIDQSWGSKERNYIRLLSDYHVQILLPALFFTLCIGLLSLVVFGGPGSMAGLGKATSSTMATMKVAGMSTAKNGLLKFVNRKL